MRLAAELGLAPEPETERLTARRRAAALRALARAGVRGAAPAIVAAGALAGLELAARLGVLDAILPELTALQGVEQSHFHHLDVLDHTLEVLRRLIALEATSTASSASWRRRSRPCSPSRWPTT